MFRIDPTQVQNIAFGLVDLHEVLMGPPLKPVLVPLDPELSPSGVLTALLSLVSSADLLKVHLIPPSMSPTKM